MSFSISPEQLINYHIIIIIMFIYKKIFIEPLMRASHWYRFWIYINKWGISTRGTYREIYFNYSLLSWYAFPYHPTTLPLILVPLHLIVAHVLLLPLPTLLINMPHCLFFVHFLPPVEKKVPPIAFKPNSPIPIF